MSQLPQEKKRQSPVHVGIEHTCPFNSFLLFRMLQSFKIVTTPRPGTMSELYSAAMVLGERSSSS